MRESRSEFSAHQEIILGLSSVTIKQAHQRPPKARKGSVTRACMSVVQTGLLLVGFAILGAMLAY
jgi:hypothetical protein